MLQANGYWDALSTDVSVIAYHADRPAFGMTLSSVLNDATVLYVEAALRKGRDRRTPILSAEGAVVGAVQESQRWLGDVVVGSQYTFGNGMTLSAEYWRNNHGFSDAEVAGIAKALRSGQGNPGLAGSLLSTPGLRRQSTFVRMGNIPLSAAATGEITWIHNLDDASRLLRSTVNWDIGAADGIRMGVDWFSGTSVSEYGAGRIRKRIFIHYKRYF